MINKGCVIDHQHGDTGRDFVSTRVADPGHDFVLGPDVRKRPPQAFTKNVFAVISPCGPPETFTARCTSFSYMGRFMIHAASVAQSFHRLPLWNSLWLARRALLSRLWVLIRG